MPTVADRSLPFSLQALFIGCCITLLSACATMPPGANYPKVESTALAHPEETVIGRKIAARAKTHRDLSGFRLFPSGSDALSLRVQMADAAERTLDIQSFIFKDDDSGQLLMSAALEAAAGRPVPRLGTMRITDSE